MPTYDSQISRAESQALIPEDVSHEILQAISRQSFVLQLATRLPDMPTKTRRLPVLSVLPTAYFVSGDTGLKQTTEVNWSNRYITAEEIAVIVPVPKLVVIIPPTAPERLTLKVSSGSLVGSGKPQCHHGVQYSIRQYALRHDGNVGDAPRGVDQDRS